MASFRSTSKKQKLRLDNKPRTMTSIKYEKGYVGNKIAVRFYKKRKMIKIIVSRTETSWKAMEGKNIWDVIRHMGGQRPESAHQQREEALTKIVNRYFEHFGYKTEEQPKIKGNTPDILARKGKHVAYLELKAYFGKTLTAEAEIAQLLKYYALAQDDKKTQKKIKNNEIYPPKFFLITTGKMLPPNKNALLNGDLKNIPLAERTDYIKSKYRKYLRSLHLGRSLEARDTRSILYYAHYKFDKYLMEEYWDNPSVVQIDEQRHLNKLIEGKIKFDGKMYEVFLVPAPIFDRLLGNIGLKREREIFNRIRATWMERLIMNRAILDLSDDE